MRNSLLAIRSKAYIVIVQTRLTQPRRPPTITPSRAGRPQPHERNIFAPLFGENPSDGHVCNAEEVVWICAPAARDCDAAGSAGTFNRDGRRCGNGRKARSRSLL